MALAEADRQLAEASRYSRLPASAKSKIIIMATFLGHNMTWCSKLDAARVAAERAAQQHADACNSRRARVSHTADIPTWKQLQELEQPSGSAESIPADNRRAHGAALSLPAC